MSWMGLRLASAPRILILKETWRCGRAAGCPEFGLQPVKDQAVLDLLRLPYIGVEGLVDVVDVRQQTEDLQHVPVDLELDPRQVVDDAPEPAPDQVGVLDRPVDGVQPDREGRAPPVAVRAQRFSGS